MACQWRVTPVGAIWLCCLGNTDAGFLTPPVSQLSAIHIAASLARAKFVVSDKLPSGYRTHHMPLWSKSRTTENAVGRRPARAYAGCTPGAVEVVWVVV